MLPLLSPPEVQPIQGLISYPQGSDSPMVAMWLSILSICAQTK